MAEIVMKSIMGILLLLCGIQDAFKKKILLWFVIMGALMIGICLPFCETFSLINSLGGVAVGASVIVISIATGGKIGLGDGMLLCVTGIGLGFWGNLELFAIALLMAAVVSIILLIFRWADRKKSIPFVPFLLTSYVFLMIVTIRTGT